MKLNPFIQLLCAITLYHSVEFKVQAQIENSSYFLIRGKAQNTNVPRWEFALTNFFDNKLYEVEFANDGSFNKKIPINGVQDIYLYLNNNAITIYALPGDTIELNWNENDFKNSFTINSPIPYRNLDLQKNIKIYNQYREPYIALSRRLYEKDTTDSIKYKWINEYYNELLKSILKDTVYYTSTSGKFLLDAYYTCNYLLLNNRLINSYALKPDLNYTNRTILELIKSYFSEIHNYKVINYSDFNLSSEYRSFLYNYTRLDKPFTFSIVNNTDDRIPFSPCMHDYYRILANIDIFPIRDCFATKVIMDGFGYYSFNEMELVLNDFLKICKTKSYQDTLMNFYDFVKRFKTGEQAPPFTLKNEQGKDVNLGDFKDKIIYIDFWGVGCAPCRSDISEYVPTLHEKYQGKDIVFINICVDSDEKTWKRVISDIKLEGINLIAEGWTNNPICKSYNITGIPHYILLDKDGRFIEYNGLRPWQLTTSKKNSIDIALEQ